MRSVLDANFIEHDTFALFQSLMSRAKPWYEFSDEGFASKRPRVRNECERAGNGGILMELALPFSSVVCVCVEEALGIIFSRAY